MKLTILGRLALVAALLIFAALPAFASPSNKWRIQCSEGAKSSGEIVLRFTPKGAAAFDVTVPIPDGTSENHVARILRDTLRQNLDAAKFQVEIDDGEDVLVKRKAGQPNFDLKVASNTVKALRIGLDRE
jgi:hypothetical protein